MNNLHSKVMARYEAIRKEEEAAMKARRAQVYQRVPRIADLETKMSLNSLQVARVHIKGPEDAQGEIRRLKEENLNLRQEKMELLVSHDFSMDYMDLKHRCRKCGDTGYLGSKRCSCYNQILAAIVYEESDFHDMLNDHSFETFDEANEYAFSLINKEMEGEDLCQKYALKGDFIPEHMYLDDIAYTN